MKYQEMIKEGLHNARLELKKAKDLADELEDVIGEATDEWIDRNIPESAPYPLSIIHNAIQIIADRLKKGTKDANK